MPDELAEENDLVDKIEGHRKHVHEPEEKRENHSVKPVILGDVLHAEILTVNSTMDYVKIWEKA